MFSCQRNLTCVQLTAEVITLKVFLALHIQTLHKLISDIGTVLLVVGFVKQLLPVESLL